MNYSNVKSAISNRYIVTVTMTDGTTTETTHRTIKLAEASAREINQAAAQLRYERIEEAFQYEALQRFGVAKTGVRTWTVGCATVPVRGAISFPFGVKWGEGEIDVCANVEELLALLERLHFLQEMETPTVETVVETIETPVVETPSIETPAIETPVIDIEKPVCSVKAELAAHLTPFLPESKRDLAAAIGIRPSSLSRVLNGEQMSFDTLEKLMSELGIAWSHEPFIRVWNAKNMLTLDVDAIFSHFQARKGDFTPVSAWQVWDVGIPTLDWRQADSAFETGGIEYRFVKHGSIRLLASLAPSGAFRLQVIEK